MQTPEERIAELDDRLLVAHELRIEHKKKDHSTEADKWLQAHLVTLCQGLWDEQQQIKHRLSVLQGADDDSNS